MADMFFDVEKIKAFIFEPTKAFNRERGSKLEEAFVYFLKTGIILAVLSGVILGAMSMNGIAAVSTMVLSYIGAIIGAIVAGLWLHLWAYIMGARKNLEQTMKTVLYSSTPMLVLGWIPVINLLMILWDLILQVIGLKRLQGLTVEKSILAVVLAVLVPIIVVVALASVAFMAMMPMIAAGGFQMPTTIPGMPVPGV